MITAGETIAYSAKCLNTLFDTIVEFQAMSSISRPIADFTACAIFDGYSVELDENNWVWLVVHNSHVAFSGEWMSEKTLGV